MTTKPSLRLPLLCTLLAVLLLGMGQNGYEYFLGILIAVIAAIEWRAYWKIYDHFKVQGDDEIL